jgi:ABC-type bacteriocin/lantibiotic exporter with double-glycine peptidase domain
VRPVGRWSRTLAAFWLCAVLGVGPIGCAAYQGTAVSADPSLPLRETGWLWVSGVPEVLQSGEKDCGPAALSAVLEYWGYATAPHEIQSSLGRASGERVRAAELTTYARAHGFDAFVFKGTMTDVMAELRQGRPVIVGVAKRYDQDVLSHYEVVVGIQHASQLVLTLDPARGWRKNTLSGFMSEWEPSGRVTIVVFPASG